MALFTYIIFSALVQMHFAEHTKKLQVGALIVLGTLSAVTGGYGIAMVIYSSKVRDVFVVDASMPLLSGCLLLFSAVLLTVLVLVLVKVRRGENNEDSLKNAKVFVGVAGVVTAVFVARFVLSIVFLVGTRKAGMALSVLKLLSGVMAGLAIIVYVGLAVLAVWKAQRERKANSLSYVSLIDDSSRYSNMEDNSVEIPARYADF
jgi:lipoprotein signal peptidase